MAKDIQSYEDEIERLMAVATKMTTSYSPMNVSSTPENKMENAIIKLEDYKSRLSDKILENLELKNRCLDKVEKIEPKSLQKILIYYYFQNYTLEKTAELIGKSVRWTYDMYLTALDKYSEVF